MARADMTSPADIERMVEATLERFGRVDVLFANAGIYVPGEFGAGDIEALTRMLAINVDAVLRCAHLVIPPMQAQGGGDIVVTSSISGFIDVHWEPIYSASKHAVQTFVHTLRRQLAGDGIRVMSLAPGQVANALWGFHDEADIKPGLRRRAHALDLGRLRRGPALHAEPAAPCHHPRPGYPAAESGEYLSGHSTGKSR